MFDVYRKIMASIEKGLNFEEGLITDKCCKDYYNQQLRLLFYPEVTLDEINKTGLTRCGAHSDYGTVALLFQKPGEGQNGLRALNGDKKWVKVVPPDYTMVVNLGDMFQHWCNDQMISTIHKVEVDEDTLEQLKEGKIERAPERQSIVLFCHSDRD